MDKTMDKTMITPSGPEFSRVVVGMMRADSWGLDADGLRGWIARVIDLGLTTFDHADIYGNYGNEGLWGRALHGHSHLRGKVQLVTKCGIQLLSDTRPQTTIHHYNTTNEHIVWSAERSLKELDTDYLDLLLIHRPDPLMDADAVAAALQRLRNDGKILHAGVSNFTPRQFELLQSRLAFPLVTNQVEFSPLFLDPILDGTFDQAQQLRRQPMVWSPLAGGRLFNPTDARSEAVRAMLGRMADKYGVEIDVIALAWVMMHPVGALPVTGTGKIERLQGAIAASHLQLERQDWFEVLVASQGHEVP